MYLLGLCCLPPVFMTFFFRKTFQAFCRNVFRFSPLMTDVITDWINRSTSQLMAVCVNLSRSELQVLRHIPEIAVASVNRERSEQHKLHPPRLRSWQLRHLLHPLSLNMYQSKLQYNERSVMLFQDRSSTVFRMFVFHFVFKTFNI